jgi:myosin heavy subunit
VILGFLDKNKDQVHPDVTALLQQTAKSHIFLRELLEASTMPTAESSSKQSKGKKKQPTLSKLFTKQMVVLSFTIVYDLNAVYLCD